MELDPMRRIIYASAAAAVLASSTGCQQCWDSFRRFEAWKYQAVFGTSPDAYAQTLAMPVATGAPICAPIDACGTTTLAAPAATIAPSTGCACADGGLTTVPALPGTIPYAPGVSPGPVTQ
jgi:hypothetical protein